MLLLGVGVFGQAIDLCQWRPHYVVDRATKLAGSSFLAQADADTAQSAVEAGQAALEGAQAQVLQEMLSLRPEIERVAGRAELLVDTVHKFQGDERDVMFFSPVVSSGISPGALGFLRSNGNLFNVAITRARGLLHVVGDRAAAARCGVDYLE